MCIITKSARELFMYKMWVCIASDSLKPYSRAKRVECMEKKHNCVMQIIDLCPGGGMVDTEDSKSSALTGVRVQVPSWVPSWKFSKELYFLYIKLFFYVYFQFHKKISSKKNKLLKKILERYKEIKLLF